MQVNAREAEEAQTQCCKMWMFLGDADWKSALSIFSEEFDAYWPQTREHFRDLDSFIEANRQILSNCKIQIQNSMYQWDQWEQTFLVATQVLITKKHDGKVNHDCKDQHNREIWASAFFELDDDQRIKSVTGYFAESSLPPASRKSLAVHY